MIMMCWLWWDLQTVPTIENSDHNPCFEIGIDLKSLPLHSFHEQNSLQQAMYDLKERGLADFVIG